MIRRLVGGVGGLTFFATTNSVMLCAGSVATKLVPVMLTSALWVMALVAVSCHTWVVPRCANEEMLTVVVTAVDSCLLITMIVKAPSDERAAANADTASAFGATAETLVSPNVDLFPS